MKKKPKQPKPVKQPKKPKQSAPASAWIRYDARAEDVKRKNAARLAAWRAKCAKIDADQRRKAQLINKYSR